MRKIRNNILIMVLAGLLALFLSVNYLRQLGYGLSYQGGISMNEGWYILKPKPESLAPHMIVAFRPDSVTEAYLVEHHWLRANTLLLKHVYAGPGDRVCIKQQAVWINGKKTVAIIADYAPGKPLPKLAFCRQLQSQEYWLMSNKIANSYDSRYFGPVQLNNIVAKAVPI